MIVRKVGVGRLEDTDDIWSEDRASRVQPGRGVASAMSHQSPPTIPEQMCSHRIGKAKQVDSFPADHARLSLGELGPCAGY